MSEATDILVFPVRTSHSNMRTTQRSRDDRIKLAIGERWIMYLIRLETRGVVLMNSEDKIPAKNGAKIAKIAPTLGEDLENIFLLTYQRPEIKGRLFEVIFQDFDNLFDTSNMATKENVIRRLFLSVAVNSVLVIAVKWNNPQLIWYTFIGIISTVCVLYLYYNSSSAYAMSIGVCFILLASFFAEGMFLVPFAIGAFVLIRYFVAKSKVS